MPDAVLLAIVFALSLTGMASLALTMEAHWAQVCEGQPQSPAAVLRLRVAGSASLAAALVLCLIVDHASMAVLVWVMTMAASALAVAFTLTWQPRWLRVLALVGRTNAVI